VTPGHRTVVLAVCSLLVAVTPAVVWADDGMATFTRSDGKTIVIDSATGTLTSPDGSRSKLTACGTRDQTCLTDGKTFSFAFPRACNDTTEAAAIALPFRPKVVTALHDDVWLVFDAAPNYLFHYSRPRGLVGIFKGSTASYDFRVLLKKQNFRISDIENREFRITGQLSIASCKA